MEDAARWAAPITGLALFCDETKVFTSPRVGAATYHDMLPATWHCQAGGRLSQMQLWVAPWLDTPFLGAVSSLVGGLGPVVVAMQLGCSAPVAENGTRVDTALTSAAGNGVPKLPACE